MKLVLSAETRPMAEHNTTTSPANSSEAQEEPRTTTLGKRRRSDSPPGSFASDGRLSPVQFEDGEITEGDNIVNRILDDVETSLPLASVSPVASGTNMQHKDDSKPVLTGDKTAVQQPRHVPQVSPAPIQHDLHDSKAKPISSQYSSPHANFQFNSHTIAKAPPGSFQFKSSTSQAAACIHQFYNLCQLHHIRPEFNVKCGPGGFVATVAVDRLGTYRCPNSKPTDREARAAVAKVALEELKKVPKPLRKNYAVLKSELIVVTLGCSISN
jgi:hypothetical protein